MNPKLRIRLRFPVLVGCLGAILGAVWMVNGAASAAAQAIPLEAPRKPAVAIQETTPGAAFPDPAEASEAGPEGAEAGQRRPGQRRPPAPAQPRPAQLNTAEPLPVTPPPARPGAGSLEQGAPAEALPAEPAPAQLDPAQPFPAQPVPPQPTPAQPVPPQPTPAQPVPVPPGPEFPAPLLPDIPRSLVPEPEVESPRSVPRVPGEQADAEPAAEEGQAESASEPASRGAAAGRAFQPNPLTGRGSWDPHTGAGGGPLLRCDRGGVLPAWGLGGCQPPRTLYDFGSDINWGVPVLDRVWVGMEYLGWAMKSARLPAVVTTSPLGTSVDESGVLGVDTTILFGDDTIHDRMRSGGRLRGGFWLTPDNTHGFEGSYFGVDGHDVVFYALGAGDRILARPYQDAVTGQPASLVTAYPGLQDGSLLATADLEFSGAEALYRRVLLREPYRQFDLLLGYRYGRLFDQFRVHEELLSLDDDSGFATDALVERTDLFKAINRFHGGEIGLEGRWMGSGGLTLKLLGKAALGASLSRFLVEGSTVVSEPQTDAATGRSELVVTERHEGGLLSQPSNIGRYNTDTFAFLGELGVSLEYVWSPNVRLSFGYTLVYWSDVARALDHVDTTINPTQFRSGDLQGADRPEFRFALEDFWAQGLNAGLEIDF